METTLRRKSWLPRLNPALAPRLEALLQPGSVADGHESVEIWARAVLEDALQNRVTDVHFEPFSQGWRVRFRLDGSMHDTVQLSPEAGQKLVRHFRARANLDPVAGFLPQGASMQADVQDRKVDLRLALVPCFGGQKLALRLLDPNRLQHRIGDLGLHENDVKRLANWLGQAPGMCLVTGPTGSGKTTTLYALLHELELSNYSVVTIEDPVEYPVDGIAQIQVDVGHGLTFATGLRAMLRMDPDYLLVGEMRDLESAQVTMEAASSGHFVMSTMHTADAAGVLTLLRNWQVPDHQIAAAVQIVVNQRLVRRLCPKCRRPAKVTEDEQAWLDSVGLPVPEMVWQPAGCEACQDTGFQGRIGVFEVWHKDETDYRLILNHADEHTLRTHFLQRGLNTVLEDGLAKVRDGVTSLQEIQSMGAHVGFEKNEAVAPPVKPPAEALTLGGGKKGA